MVEQIMCIALIVIEAVLFLKIGYDIGRDIRNDGEYPKNKAPAPVETEDSIRTQYLEREKMMEDQASFTNLMGYNIDVAYGTKSLSGENRIGS